MSAAAKCVVLDTWAGRRYYAVEVLGETPKKARVRVLTPGGVMLPGRRYVQCGEVALVPKHAIYESVERLALAAFSVLNHSKSPECHFELKQAVMAMGFCPRCEWRPCECREDD